jgi:hypothetical protein
VLIFDAAARETRHRASVETVTFTDRGIVVGLRQPAFSYACSWPRPAAAAAHRDHWPLALDRPA